MLPTQRTALVDDGALVHDLHGLGAGRPQRVDDTLHVLLVHDEVVGACALGQQPVGGARRVGQASPAGRAR